MPLVAALAAAEAAEAATKGTTTSTVSGKATSSKPPSESSNGNGNDGFVAVFLPALFNAEEEVTAAVAQRCRPAAIDASKTSSSTGTGTNDSGSSSSSCNVVDGMNDNSYRSPHTWQGWSAAAAVEMTATAEREKSSAYEQTLAKLNALDLHAAYDSAESESTTTFATPSSNPISTSSSWAVASVQRDALLLHTLWQQRRRELEALDQAAEQAAKGAQRASELAEKAALDAAAGLIAWPTQSSSSSSSSSSRRNGNSQSSFGSSPQSRPNGAGATSITGAAAAAAAAAPATRAAVAAAEASLAAQIAGKVKALNEVGASVSFPSSSSPSFATSSPSLSPLPSSSPMGTPRTNTAGSTQPPNPAATPSMSKAPTTIASLGAAFAAASETARLKEPLGEVGETLVYPWEAKYPKGWLEEANNDNLISENENGGVNTNSDGTNQEDLSDNSSRGVSGSGSSIDEPISALTVRHRLASLAASAQARWGGKRLSLAQAQAVALATDEKLLLVSGGPGVGKTETVRGCDPLIKGIRAVTTMRMNL